MTALPGTPAWPKIAELTPSVTRLVEAWRTSGLHIFPTIAAQRWEARCPNHPNDGYCLAIANGELGRALACNEGCIA